MKEQTIYQENGYANRTEYLHDLADEYGVDYETVAELAFILGESEDFDGLVSNLEDFEIPLF